MRALKFLGNSKSEMTEMEIPKPKEGQVLLKVMISAVCGSERYGYAIPDPIDYVSGHEVTGIVEDANGSRILKKGDRVTVNVIEGCGKCFYCRAGKVNLCPSLAGWNGAHAEYMCIPETCCFLLPEDVPFDIGILIGGDTLGVAYRAVSKIKTAPGKVVLVTGAGAIGLGVIFFLKYYGYQVIVSEVNKYRRKYAEEIVGADLVVNPMETDLKRAVGEMTNGLGADAVIECTGNAMVQKSALEMVRPQGTVVLCGENFNGLTINPSMDLVHREVTLTGAFYFTKTDYEEMLELYRRGMNPDCLVSHRYMLEEAPKAFELFFQGDTGKVLLYREDTRNLLERKASTI